MLLLKQTPIGLCSGLSNRIRVASRGCKNIIRQSLRSKLLLKHCRFEHNLKWLRTQNFCFVSDLQLWPIIFLQPLHLQVCKYLIWKFLVRINWRFSPSLPVGPQPFLFYPEHTFYYQPFLFATIFFIFATNLLIQMFF